MPIMTFGDLLNPNYEGNKVLDVIKDLVLGFGLAVVIFTLFVVVMVGLIKAL